MRMSTLRLGPVHELRTAHSSKAAADKKAKYELAVYNERIRLEREGEGETKLEVILSDARRALAEKAGTKTRPRRKK